MGATNHRPPQLVSKSEHPKNLDIHSGHRRSEGDTANQSSTPPVDGSLLPATSDDSFCITDWEISNWKGRECNSLQQEENGGRYKFQLVNTHVPLQPVCLYVTLSTQLLSEV